MKAPCTFRSAFCLLAMTVGFSAARAEQIGFNDTASLLAMPRPFSGARDTFANFYQEKGMLFRDGVDPPDPALRWVRHNHFHLTFEDATITSCIRDSRFVFPARMTSSGCMPVEAPENEPRRLSSMVPGHVIQMVYDPNGDGVPDPFNLISIEVFGALPILNVGTKSAAGISVYNNLSGGFTWFLIDANNLTRATLETPFSAAGPFVVDNIVFQPSSSASAPAGAARTKVHGAGVAQADPGDTNEVPLAQVPPTTLDPILREVEGMIPLEFSSLSVSEARVELRGPGADVFAMSGNMAIDTQDRSAGDLLGEGVIVTLGGLPDGFREVIPAQLFTCSGNAGEQITCDFSGAPGGITRMRLAIANNELQVQTQAEALNLAAIEAGKPVTTTLQVGADLSVATISPESISSQAVQPTASNSQDGGL